MKKIALRFVKWGGGQARGGIVREEQGVRDMTHEAERRLLP